MADQPLNRQQLYDRIRATSRDEFVLAEMKRLGFWKADEGVPSVAESLIQREGTLHRELNELLEKQRRYENREKMLTEMRKARMEAAKKRREETKQKNVEKQQARAAVWAEQKTREITYLGEDVSAGLQSTESDAARLAGFGLPHFDNVAALAQAMGLTLGELRFLTFHRKVATTSHYQRFYLAKKTGGQRLISAPMPRLKTAQYWVLNQVLYRIASTENAHGFVPKRSILTNARPHLDQDVVINLDLKDFFPTLDYKRVKGLFSKLGYSNQLATIFALLCTQPEVDVIAIDGKTYYVAKGERVLPQGAPTSPAITNLICYRMDRRFEGLAKTFGFTYTRYADDLTFSASGESAEQVTNLLWAVRQIVEAEGFHLHPNKQKVMRKGNRQEVTGIIVNQHLGIERDTLRRFRALLHQIDQTGIQGKKWGTGGSSSNNLLNSMVGYANFVAMVKPESGAKLKAQVAALLAKPGIQREIEQSGLKTALNTPPVKPPSTVKNSPTPKPPDKTTPPDDKPWWDVLK